MGHDKIQVVNEKRYEFNGIFDIKETYSFLKEFLEESRHYEVSEKDYEEKIDNGSRKIMSKSEAEVEYNDYYKIIIKFELVMQGKDIEVKVNEKKTMKLTKGSAVLTVNCYIEPNFQNIKPKLTDFGEFLERIYDKFFRGSELEACKESAANDVGELIARFKVQMNSVLK